jgi:hypothetical protein
LFGIVLITIILALSVAGWASARAKARRLYSGRGSLHSLPSHHGWHMALWIAIPALAGLALWSVVQPGLIHQAIMASPEAATLPTMDLERDTLLSEAYQLAADPDTPVFNEAARPFAPIIAAATAKYQMIGAIVALLLAFRVSARCPLFWGTLYIGAVIAMIVAIPLGLMSAIYLTQYASARARRWIKPMLEILAGVPTVVYGYFAALTVAPFSPRPCRRAWPWTTPRPKARLPPGW